MSASITSKQIDIQDPKQFLDILRSKCIRISNPDLAVEYFRNKLIYYRKDCHLKVLSNDPTTVTISTIDKWVSLYNLIYNDGYE
jgi:hypothetical protein